MVGVLLGADAFFSFLGGGLFGKGSLFCYFLFLVLVLFLFFVYLSCCFFVIFVSHLAVVSVCDGLCDTAKQTERKGEEVMISVRFLSDI